ncbi:hypothetical protein F4780DRAFT_47055 [Xylariomycetidae sp. FL0641]|nr:hypothetical protein F4780DRAFT_47055 [Xylariomycetidae sp. FL0641]
MVSISDLLIGSEALPNEEQSRPRYFCQATFFYYSCGCRSTEPAMDPGFNCRPTPQFQAEADGNESACQHTNPTIQVARLPTPCNRSPARSEDCLAADPARLQFVREVDTADRLEMIYVGEGRREELKSLVPLHLQGDPKSVKEELTNHYLKTKYRTKLFPRVTPIRPSAGMLGSGMTDSTGWPKVVRADFPRVPPPPIGWTVSTKDTLSR